jgi:hypothetical protein
VTNLSFKDSSTVAWTVASGGGLQTNQANVVDNSITSNKISGKINAGQIDGAAVNVTASFPLASSGGANPNITAAGISGGGHLLGSNGPIMFNATVLGAILGTPPMNGNNVTNQHAFKGGSVVLSNLFQILCTQLADGNTNVTFVMNTNFTTPTVSTAIAQAAAQAMQSNFFMVPYTNGNTVFEYDMVNGRAIITNIATGPSSLNYRDSGGTNYAGGLDGPQTNQIKGLALSLLPVVNDYYISPSNSLAYEGTATILGLGTQANPYRGDFDAIVNSLPSYSVIHPMPGTNWTRAYMGQSTNLSLKEGMVLAGYGQGISIIKRDPTVAPVGASVQVIASTSNNIVVRDLTVDCSGTNELSTAALGGVILGGSRETVMNVTVLNYAGSTNNGGFETWAFDLGAYVGPSTYGHILVDCTASNSVGHYDNGFSVVGQANDIHGNVSYITNVMDSLHRVAFNLQHSRNTVWEGCQGYGGLDLFYADTGSVSNVTLRDNMGNNCARGVTLFVGSGNGWSVQNVSIAGNTINVSTNYFSANKGFVTLLCRETNAASSWNNILVDGNHFGFASPFAGTQIDGNQGSFVVKGFTSNVVGLIRNLTITHNQVDDNLPISIVNVSGLNIKDNYDQFGKPYYNLPDMRDMLAQERALNPLGKGLVLYLPFNEGVGTNVYDWSAVYRNPNAAATPSHLQIIGGYPYSWSTNGPMTNGIVGSPFITNNGSASTEFVVNTTSGFSLTNASLDPSASATFTNCLASSLSFSGSNLTTYIWYKQPAAAAGYSAVPFFFFKNGGGPAFSYAIAGNGTYLWYVTTLMTSNFMQQTASNFCDGNWHNFASTWDGLTWTTYIDNTLIKTNVCRGVFSTLVSPSGNTQPLYLGMSSGGNPTNAVGVITNVMLGAMGKTMIATSTWTYPQLSNQYILDTQYPNFP